MFSDFISSLEQKLKNPLPGHDSWMQNSGSVRINPKYLDFSNLKHSAVLIAFYPSENEIYLPLILRPPYDGTHGGQMAFPGGRMEDFDKTYENTALREAEEEIGILASDVKLIGHLTEVFIPPSKYWVKPIIGYLDYKPTFKPDVREVADVYEMSLDYLKDPNNIEKREIQVRGKKMLTKGFTIEEQWVWGATALMLGELIEVLKD